MTHRKSAVRVKSIQTVTREEAKTYLDDARGDELEAAVNLAIDRNVLEGSDREPDDTDIHHALYMLRRAAGKEAPSYDSMRVMLRARAA